MPVRLRQDDRLFVVHRIADREQRLQLPAEVEAGRSEGVQLLPALVPVARRVGHRVDARRPVVVLIRRQRLEGVERGLVADAARQPLRPRHARQTAQRLDQVEPDHAAPDRRARLDPGAVDLRTWTDVGARYAGIAFRVVVRPGDEGIHVVRSPDRFLASHSVFGSIFVNRRLVSHFRFARGILDSGEIVFPGRLRLRVEVNLIPPAVVRASEVARLVGGPDLLYPEHLAGVVEVVVGQREAEHVGPRIIVADLETRGRVPVVVGVAVLAVAVHVHAAEERGLVFLEAAVQRASERIDVLGVARLP